jgi:phosphatidate cytidylyltransferase
MPIYLLAPFYLLVTLNHHPVYHELLFILFVIVFSFDSGSYITGTMLGKHYIARFISPKKTWEGFIGGYIFACVGFAALIIENEYTIAWPIAASLTFVICALSFTGDLFESWLKRRANLKHSGTLLPGHGGFLDRFDGIIFAVFFFYFFKEQLVTFLLGAIV